MANSLARNSSPNTTAAAERGAPWTPLNQLLGFDPFQALRAARAFEYDVVRTERGYEVEVPVAGYAPDEIDVSFKDGVITVAGNNDRHTFTRSFTVPEEVDPDAITAHVQNGMLTLTLQRHPEAQPRKIVVNK
ncbi:MAG: Hsp20/alpha crystallin family protein [Candidatus Eremiobacteraeota bacterium]|nr:Hsp20/alpha crystallin family protein [Candidatus Eremiobacteraeota bacterium]